MKTILIQIIYQMGLMQNGKGRIMEYLDILDKNGNKTGEKKNKKRGT